MSFGFQTLVKHICALSSWVTTPVGEPAAQVGKEISLSQLINHINKGPIYEHYKVTGATLGKPGQHDQRIQEIDKKIGAVFMEYSLNELSIEEEHAKNINDAKHSPTQDRKMLSIVEQQLLETSFTGGTNILSPLVQKQYDCYISKVDENKNCSFVKNNQKLVKKVKEILQSYSDPSKGFVIEIDEVQPKF